VTSDPKTSAESKETSHQALSELEPGYDPANALDVGDKEAFHDPMGGKNAGNFIGGHKVIPFHSDPIMSLIYCFVIQANLKNPNTSEEAKERSRKVLSDLQSDE
jgi:hypothetical protein